MTLGTEFTRDFCAGIGPLQLGVVLVFLIISKVVKIKPSYWMEKKRNFIGFFSISII